MDIANFIKQLSKAGFGSEEINKILAAYFAAFKDVPMSKRPEGAGRVPEGAGRVPEEDDPDHHTKFNFARVDEDGWVKLDLSERPHGKTAVIPCHTKRGHERNLINISVNDDGKYEMTPQRATPHVRSGNAGIAQVCSPGGDDFVIVLVNTGFGIKIFVLRDTETACGVAVRIGRDHVRAIMVERVDSTDLGVGAFATCYGDTGKIVNLEIDKVDFDAPEVKEAISLFKD